MSHDSGFRRGSKDFRRSLPRNRRRQPSHGSVSYEERLRKRHEAHEKELERARRSAKDEDEEGKEDDT